MYVHVHVHACGNVSPSVAAVCAAHTGSSALSGTAGNAEHGKMSEMLPVVLADAYEIQEYYYNSVTQ